MSEQTENKDEAGYSGCGLVFEVQTAENLICGQDGLCSECAKRLAAENAVWQKRWAAMSCSVEDAESAAWLDDTVWETENPLLQFWFKVQEIIEQVETDYPLPDRGYQIEEIERRENANGTRN